ncbi:protein of unknown function [Candidatus Methylomirabilis oxygeniifera]|uniref:Uncharacterized protein n=1 Tax=Methylomirabilis oxygeniifera TaxID=671143 RepID=D5MGS0_METO1|nr:protein of unknown function [Candidatus Methylomirabilis oxyfera]
MRGKNHNGARFTPRHERNGRKKGKENYAWRGGRKGGSNVMEEGEGAGRALHCSTHPGGSKVNEGELAAWFTSRSQ